MDDATSTAICNKAWKERQKAAGHCTGCRDGIAVAGTTKCQKCRDYARQYYVQRVSSGACVQCTKRRAAKGRSLCETCCQKDKDTRAALIETGTCITCKKRPASDNRQRCEECRARIAAKWQQERIAVLQHYGAECKCCGEKTLEFLHLDHVRNDGNTHRKTLQGSIYSWARRHHYPNTLQVLCANCNLAKEFYGICPHEKMRLENGRDAA